MVTVQCWTGAQTKALRQAMRLSIRAFATHLGIGVRTANAALSAANSHGLQLAVWQDVSSRGGDEHEALELARRVAASDVSTETLGRLESMVDELAVKYPLTPPQGLIGPVRRHVSYVMQLLDARKTLDEHRRLLIVGAWLSLISATLYIDLEQ